MDWKGLPDHPRILLLRGEEEQVRQTIASQEAWKKIHLLILKECDRLQTLPPVERIQIGRRLLDKSRECLRRVFFLSYAWRMTHEDRYRQRAEKELLAVAAFSDWNPSHFLDVAEMTMAVALGYDWLYASLPQSSRSVLQEAILKKGIEPSRDSRFNSWLKAPTNWNQVCNAGMTFGALATYEKHPELSQRIVERALESINLPMEDYNPDGGYPEGYGYWGYGTNFHVMFLSTLEKLFGPDKGLSTSPGFMKTAGYLEHMTGPSGNCFNYSDSALGGGLQPAMFWFASRLKNPSLLFTERRHLEKEADRQKVTNRLLPAALLWGSGSKLQEISEPAEKIWVGQGKNPVALMRTSWSDPNALFVAIKGGSPSVNHGHMDIGSFVMESDGVRWAMDFGSDNYNTLETHGVDLWGREQNSGRWKVFRYNNLAHNTLSINQEFQRVAGHAAITSHSSQPAFLNAQLDLSPVYQGLVSKLERGIAIVDQHYVVVQDELEALPNGQGATVRWALLTAATVKILGPGQAELTRDGKKLLLRVVSPEKVTLKTWPTKPANDYEASNAGTSLVGFEVALAERGKTDLKVMLLPSQWAKLPAPQALPLSQWPR